MSIKPFTEERLETLFKAKGVRVTAIRIIVHRALEDADRPLSLHELEDKLPTVDKSSIFRTLVTFRDHQLVHIIEDGEGVRYELCTSVGDVHDDLHIHFYCECCRQTFCLEGIPVPAVTIPNGYLPRSASYMVKGLCPACAHKRGI